MSRLDDWTPIRVYPNDDGLMVDWCHMGTERFTDPFFSETVERRLHDPFAMAFRVQTSIDEMVEMVAETPGVPPAGFIFHMSRCGSTLVSQMLARLPELVVLSEPAPVEGLLRMLLQWPGVAPERWITWLRALVGAMTRPRTGVERRCVVKVDTWQALALPLIRAAFPEVPWIFLHRDPVEVLVSHQRSRAAAMMPGPFPPALFGMEWNEVGAMSVDEYGARVLGAVCGAALQHLHDGGLAVAYRDLPDAVTTTIADHFALELTPGQVESARAASGLDAKRPDRTFVADSARKREAASPELRQAAEMWATPSWRRLDDISRGVAAVGAA